MPLRLRDRVGLNLPPLFLRLMLGIVFVWAGLGKVSQMFDVSGESAAALANMGVLSPAVGSVPNATPMPQPAPVKAPDVKPLEPKAPEVKPPDAKQPPRTKPSGALLPAPGQARIVLVRQQAAARTYTAAEFPTPVRVRALYQLALMLRASAAPEAGKLSLWPASLANGSVPVYLAWAVAITELAGGIFLLLGLLTRLAAFGIACVMMGAIWLTQIGPAIQSGKTVLGFLPDYPAFDGEKWTPLFFQFALCMAALALAFCGPGRLSLDTALLSGRGEEDDED